MIPYFIITIIVYSLALYIEKSNAKKINKNILFIIIVFAISIFAGLRDESVGTDVKVYVVPILNMIKNRGFFITYKTFNVEILFVILAQIIKMINGNIVAFLFLIQFIISFCILFYGYKNEKRLSFSIFVLVYMMMILGVNFNLIRQSIAIALTIYAFDFMKEKKWLKYILIMIIAMNFHITAGIALLIPLIYYTNNKKIGVIIKYFIITFFILFIIFFKEIFEMLLNYNILSYRYNTYINELYNSELKISITGLTLKVIIISILLLKLVEIKDKKEKSLYIFLLLMDCIIYTLGFKVKYATRISYYFYFLLLLNILPLKSKNNNALYKIIIILFLISYFYIEFCHLGNNAIIPYILNK